MYLCTAFDTMESCLSGRKSRTRNAVYALRRTGGSNPSLSAGLSLFKDTAKCPFFCAYVPKRTADGRFRRFLRGDSVFLMIKMYQQKTSENKLRELFSDVSNEPRRGLEPRTYSLRMSRSTN